MGKRLSAMIAIWIGLQLLVAGCAADPVPTTILPTPVKSPTSEDEGADALATDEAAKYAEERAWMVQEGIIAWGVEDEDVIEVMGIVPRHAFVPQEYLERAYFNHLHSSLLLATHICHTHLLVLFQVVVCQECGNHRQTEDQAAG